jgi:hypothetical protein
MDSKEIGSENMVEIYLAQLGASEELLGTW